MNPKRSCSLKFTGNRKHGIKLSQKEEYVPVPVKILPTRLHLMLPLPLLSMVGLTSVTKEALIKYKLGRAFGEPAKRFRVLIIKRKKPNTCWIPLYTFNFSEEDLQTNHFKILCVHSRDGKKLTGKVKDAFIQQQIQMKKEKNVRYPCPY